MVLGGPFPAQCDQTGFSYGFALIRACGKFLDIALKRNLSKKMAIDYSAGWALWIAFS